MLTVKQVAARLQISLSSVYELIARGQLPAFRLGPRRGAIRVRPEDLASYLAATSITGTATPLRQPSQGGTTFRHLSGERLRAAWQRQGVRVGQPE